MLRRCPGRGQRKKEKMKSHAASLPDGRISVNLNGKGRQISSKVEGSLRGEKQLANVRRIPGLQKNIGLCRPKRGERDLPLHSES